MCEICLCPHLFTYLFFWQENMRVIAELDKLPYKTEIEDLDVDIGYWEQIAEGLQTDLLDVSKDLNHLLHEKLQFQSEIDFLIAKRLNIYEECEKAYEKLEWCNKAREALLAKEMKQE